MEKEKIDRVNTKIINEIQISLMKEDLGDGFEDNKKMGEWIGDNGALIREILSVHPEFDSMWGNEKEKVLEIIQSEIQHKKAA